MAGQKYQPSQLPGRVTHSTKKAEAYGWILIESMLGLALIGLCLAFLTNDLSHENRLYRATEIQRQELVFMHLLIEKSKCGRTTNLEKQLRLGIQLRALSTCDSPEKDICSCKLQVIPTAASGADIFSSRSFPNEMQAVIHILNHEED